jgi:hypothetical protein
MAARFLAPERPPLATSIPGALLLVGACLLALGCSTPAPASTCVQGLDLTCSPLYSPTFDQVYARTLHPTCAQSGASCHSAEGKQGGLDFDDPDRAYSLLLGEGGGKARVVAGDAACSLLVERIESADKKSQMPPGSPLSAAERCALEQWIENGAKR